MGMFDRIEVFCELPRLPDGHDRQFQTKSLDCYLGNYRIDEQGALWREDFDIEDHSDPNATGYLSVRGMRARVNKRWVCDTYTGEIEFYDYPEGLSLEYKAWFRGGQMRDLVPSTEE